MNRTLINEFKIEKGTGQGCSLSLLFILELEISASKIKSDSKIEGLKADGEKFKLKSHADYVFLTNLNIFTVSNGPN